jgi:membrane protein
MARPPSSVCSVFIALAAAVTVLYRYAPSLVIPWRWIIAGAACFTSGWLIATAALGIYVGNFADYGATYGSLSAVIILMLWFYVTAVMLLLGAEVTAALARARTPEQIRPRGEEHAAAAAVEEATRPVREQVKGAIGDR